jgi:hypothetical protein
MKASLSIHFYFPLRGIPMKDKKNLSPLSLLVLIFLLAGCNLPIKPTATPFVLPTALPSDTPMPIPPTATPPLVATATLAPTNTPYHLPTATNTYVLPSATATTSTRPSANIVAPYMSKAPNYDGVWDEWTAKQYPAKFLVYGTNKAGGKTLDLEGAFSVAWDNNYLYLAAKIYDPVYVQEASGANLFKGDSLEILFDNNLTGDFSTKSLDSDDFQLGISPGQGSKLGNKPEAYLWYPSSRAGSQNSVKIGVAQQEGLYRVEAGIPWSVLNTTPASGKTYGFVFSISYDNNPGTTHQDAVISNVSTRTLTDPSTWGTLSLTR